METELERPFHAELRCLRDIAAQLMTQSEIFRAEASGVPASEGLALAAPEFHALAIRIMEQANRMEDALRRMSARLESDVSELRGALAAMLREMRTAQSG